MRNKYKLLGEKYVTEIGLDTLRAAQQAATNRGRVQQAAKFGQAADEKMQQQIANIIGADTNIIFYVDRDPSQTYTGRITNFGKVYEGNPTIELMLTEPANEKVILYFQYGRLNGFVMDRAQLDDIAFDRPSRIKMVKLFKHMGLNINANNIDILGEETDAQSV